MESQIKLAIATFLLDLFNKKRKLEENFEANLKNKISEN